MTSEEIMARSWEARELRRCQVEGCPNETGQPGGTAVTVQGLELRVRVCHRHELDLRGTQWPVRPEVER